MEIHGVSIKIAASINIYIYMLAPPPKPTFSHCDEGDRSNIAETCTCNSE